MDIIYVSICFLEYGNPEKIKCYIYILNYILIVCKKGGQCHGERNTQEK